MAPSDEVLELTERFDRNRESYLSGQYNETQLRREFLDPLFMALGWDVNNKQGYAEAYKDDIHEDALKIGSAVKRLITASASEAHVSFSLRPKSRLST